MEVDIIFEGTKKESGQPILMAGALANAVHFCLACFGLPFLLTCYLNIEVVCLFIFIRM